MVDKRNIYARIRTLMSNERTLMAYYRTSLTLVGISAFVYKFYQSAFFMVIAIIFVLASAGIAVYGTLRFLDFKKRIMRR